MPSHFDLPVMSGYSRIEQKIVARFVTVTKNYTGELATKLQQVSGWSLEAVHDVMGWIKVIWRLSWIRREMRRLEQDIDRVRKARGVVEDFISRSEIGGLEPNPKTNQRDLLAAFTEFEVATGKVTAMRAKLRSEIARNEDMKNWLSMYKAARQQNNPEKTPPEASDVQALGSILADHLVGGALDGALDGQTSVDGRLETKSASENISKQVTHNKSQDFYKKKNRHAHKGARI
jgi:hypothetical protein